MQIDLEEPEKRIMFRGFYEDSDFKEEISTFKKTLLGWKRI